MIVGFAGKAASGKTTAANFMQDLLPGSVRIIPMAQVLRDEVETFLRAVGAEAQVHLVYGSQDDKVRVFHLDAARSGRACRRWEEFVAVHADIQDRPGQTAVTVRRLLQWWGTEYRRSEDPDYWTKAWARTVAKLEMTVNHILVDDVRFMNELQTVRGRGGRIVKIERPGVTGAGDHASETSLDDYRDWDRVIRNAGSLDDFRQQIALLTEQLLTGA